MSDEARLIEGSRLLPVIADSNARDEPASSIWPAGPRLCDGSDFLAEIICSAAHPWFSIWKLSSRIAQPLSVYMCVGSFGLTFVGWFLFVISLSASADADVGQSPTETAGWRAGVFFLGALFVLLVSTCVAALRGIFRARRGIAGNAARGETALLLSPGCAAFRSTRRLWRPKARRVAAARSKSATPSSSRL